MHISEKEYQQISQLIDAKFGISLGTDKKPLLLNRLKPLLVEQGIQGFEEYYQQLIADSSGQLLIDLANRITTNYSFFYREPEHFKFLQQQALPQKIAQPPDCNGVNLHFWSAGCSSGDEPYTLAIILRDFFKNSISIQWDLGILATDIDTNVLGFAQRGLYPADRLKNVPPLHRLNYFQSAGKEMWQVKPELKELIRFSRYNLKQSHFSFKSKFFVIFCRNVLIYFDRPTVTALVQRFYDVTEKGGYFMISQTERLDKNECPYRYVAPAIYQKV